MEEGLDGDELCKAWLGEAVPSGDPPIAVQVSGRRASGGTVHLTFRCRPDERPATGSIVDAGGQVNA